jgi:hypothetical protein
MQIVGLFGKLAVFVLSTAIDKHELRREWRSLTDRTQNFFCCTSEKLQKAKTEYCIQRFAFKTRRALLSRTLFEAFQRENVQSSARVYTRTVQQTSSLIRKVNRFAIFTHPIGVE